MLLRIWRILRSRRLAVGLIVLLALLCVVGGVFPQEGDQEYIKWRDENPRIGAVVEYTGVNAVFVSLPFILLVAAIGISTLTCTIARVWNAAAAGLANRTLPGFRRTGSAVFHIGILITILGAVISSLTRLEGRLVLIEGHALPLEESSFSDFGIRGALSEPSFPFQIQLTGFSPQHETSWGGPDHASNVAILEDGVRREATARVNSPIVHRGVTIYQGSHGFAPRFMYADRRSGKVFSSYIALDTDWQADPVRYSGAFDVPGTDVNISAEFFPDATVDGDGLRNLSPIPRNPAALVVVQQAGHTLYSGPAMLGRLVEYTPGVCVALGRPRYWVEFSVVKDSGAWLVLTGAWIAVAGLCVRFIPLGMKRREQEGNA
ncbi:MAG: cytochrome c biogenesis protein ResB [Planctomycetota bacterium]|jgi:cytochrome c biogenesis protein ResB